MLYVNTKDKSFHLKRVKTNTALFKLHFNTSCSLNKYNMAILKFINRKSQVFPHSVKLYPLIQLGCVQFANTNTTWILFFTLITIRYSYSLMTEQTWNTNDHGFLSPGKTTPTNPLKITRSRSLTVYAREYMYSRFDTKQRDRGIMYSGKIRNWQHY